MANRLLALFFTVVAYISLCLQSSHHSSVEPDLPPRVPVPAGETRLVSPLPHNHDSPAQKTASLLFPETNPVVLVHVDVLMICPSGGRAPQADRFVLLHGFVLDIFKPPILSFEFLPS